MVTEFHVQLFQFVVSPHSVLLAFIHSFCFLRFLPLLPGGWTQMKWRGTNNRSPSLENTGGKSFTQSTGRCFLQGNLSFEKKAD
jgi:hypothetical protein